jgi:hypothetical protein
MNKVVPCSLNISGFFHIQRKVLIREGHIGLILKISLLKVKGLALRYGLWFTTLNQVERSALNITIQYVDIVKSTKLVNMLAAIIQNLSHASINKITLRISNIGILLAKKTTFLLRLVGETCLLKVGPLIGIL